MKDNFNLIPQNLQVNSSLVSALKTIRSIGVIGIVAFTLFCLGMGGYFIFSKITLGNLETNISAAKSQVQNQESSEQSLILLKDRLAKITFAKGTANSAKNIDNLITLFTNLSQNSKIDQGNVNPNKVSISVGIVSNEDLSNFIGNLRSSNLFKSIDMTSLNYVDNLGYSLDLDMNSK